MRFFSGHLPALPPTRRTRVQIFRIFRISVFPLGAHATVSRVRKFSSCHLLPLVSAVSRRSSSSSACLDVQTQNARESCAKKAKKPERREQEATATPAPTEAATEAAVTPAAAEAAAAPKERRRPQRSPEDGPKSPARTHTRLQRPKNGKTERYTGAPTSGYPLRGLGAKDAAYLQALFTK